MVVRVFVAGGTGVEAHAGKPNMRKPDRFFATTNRLRSEGTDHLLAAAEATGVSHVVAQSAAIFNGIREGGWVKTVVVKAGGAVLRYGGSCAIRHGGRGSRKSYAGTARGMVRVREPSAEELNHDFLWRYQCALPGRGRIGIFNRSHYEEVLVVRVHPDLLAAEHLSAQARKHGVWARRYQDINDWERSW